MLVTAYISLMYHVDFEARDMWCSVYYWSHIATISDIAWFCGFWYHKCSADTDMDANTLNLELYIHQAISLCWIFWIVYYHIFSSFGRTGIRYSYLSLNGLHGLNLFVIYLKCILACNHCYDVIPERLFLWQAVSSHATNSSAPSTVVSAQQQQPLQQQQQQPLANMYPQVHISHFPNFMPYRHMFSPVYVPPMAMPNYSSNPAYPHPSNASSYLLMPGGSSHVTAGGMKYAASQYKPVPAGSPTAYGNYANPTGFTISPPGSVGGATGLEDASRIKYKDNNLYVPNPQVMFLVAAFIKLRLLQSFDGS